ncbi:hypothetical protein DVA86_01640 [Streptomyces armeniacus]|uniref:Small CPxCG-related zinc finger protein n=1 Tax=Streptomyces armeniacus TaxID=83291 RepID=A0A345XZE5_9ACTN|nr:hypothetical protein [Streptomyces armeniacus]AXK37011.1 hypothetical protein DVA86_01640 [Streptomyces armeniacus]
MFVKVDEKTTGRTVCALCGTTAEETPVTWVCSVENGDRRYFCEECSRAHLRAIEGRIDSSWW